MSRPLLLVDVDGVISLFGFDPRHPPPGKFEMVDGIAHLLSASAGEHLRRLGEEFEPVWCTGWEEKANEYLPHALGLDKSFPYLSFAGAVPQVNGHWKLAAIDRYAGRRRPLAWIDDAHDERCGRWAAERPGPTLLISTEPATGLSPEHVEQLLSWAAQVTAATT
jgi:HAD domain in Swiss Army Knife RNA repair proteins